MKTVILLWRLWRKRWKGKKKKRKFGFDFSCPNRITSVVGLSCRDNRSSKPFWYRGRTLSMFYFTTILLLYFTVLQFWSFLATLLCKPRKWTLSFLMKQFHNDRNPLYLLSWITTMSSGHDVLYRFATKICFVTPKLWWARREFDFRRLLYTVRESIFFWNSHLMSSFFRQSLSRWLGHLRHFLFLSLESVLSLYWCPEYTSSLSLWSNKHGVGYLLNLSVSLYGWSVK